MEKDFDGWNEKKKHIDGCVSSKFYREREIWWCSIGLNIGTEQNGKGADFGRPVLILKRLGPICVILPLTSSKNKHVFRISLGLVLGRESSVVISQIKVVDAARLVQKVGKISVEKFADIRKAVKDML